MMVISARARSLMIVLASKRRDEAGEPSVYHDERERNEQSARDDRHEVARARDVHDAEPRADEREKREKADDRGGMARRGDAARRERCPEPAPFRDEIARHERFLVSGAERVQDAVGEGEERDRREAPNSLLRGDERAYAVPEREHGPRSRCSGWRPSADPTRTVMFAVGFRAVMRLRGGGRARLEWGRLRARDVFREKANDPEGE